MNMRYSLLFLLVNYLLFFAGTTFAAETSEFTETCFTNLPAVTLQMQNNGLIKTKFVKVQTEENYGLWIALDGKTNNIYYRVLQDENQNAAVINTKKIEEFVRNFIDKNTETLKKYVNDIIDFNQANYYLKLIEDYISQTQIPTIKDISAGIFNLVDTEEVIINKTFAKAEFSKSFMGFDNLIKVWQKKYDISDQNRSEVYHLGQKLQSYIDTHPANDSDKNYSNDFSFTLNPDQEPTHHPTSWNPNIIPTDTQKPYITHLFQTKNVLYKTINTPSSDLSTQYSMLLNAYVYLPPVDEQYGDYEKLETFHKKIEALPNYLKEHSNGSILKPDANEKIKEKANETMTMAIDKIKELQEKFNEQIDKVCDKIKSFF
ncbi:hypothetical protein KAT92_01155 [Candidatus Babeliales bacterium]|nr:hypothetical protein [Candidatus Babeliales bacterium]